MAEPLNIERRPGLLAYLRDHGLISPQEEPVTEVLTGGVSNRTVLLRRETGEAWVLKQALERLRVEVDWFSRPERIRQEALGLRWLGRLLPPGSVPALIFEDPSEHLLVMQAVPQPSTNWKVMLLGGHVNADHIVQFARVLSQIHARGYEERASLRAAFADVSFFESLRVEPYYQYTASRVAAARPFVEALVESTRRHRVTLVHGDFSPKNILIHQDRLILLDHEVIHFGDPAFDVGFSMTHLLSKAHYRPDTRRLFREAAVLYWRTYVDGIPDVPWKPSLRSRAVRHTLGCLLARVEGRSPLEYLGAEARRRQTAAAVALMEDAPASMETLIDAFLTRIAHAEDRELDGPGSARQPR